MQKTCNKTGDKEAGRRGSLGLAGKSWLLLGESVPRDRKEHESNGWCFYNVSELGLERILKAGLSPYRVRRCLFVLGMFQHFHYVYHIERHVWTHVSSKAWRFWLGQYYKEALLILEGLGILEVDHHYIVGEKTKRFRIAEKYSHKTIKYAVLWKTQARKIRDVRGRIARGEGFAPSYLHVQRTVLEQLTIESELAMAHIDNSDAPEKSKEAYRYSVEAIKEKDFNFSCDKKTGRFFHNFANLHRELRQFCRLGGERMVELDIKAAQPLFLAKLYGSSEADRAEREYFMRWVNGSFYEELAADAGYPDMDKKTAKRRVFIEVFFDKDRHWKRHFEQAFKRNFPRLFEKIREVKKDDYKRIAHLLQSIEAHVVMGNACAALADLNIPVVSLHDGIFCKESQADIVKKVLEDALEQEMGCPATVERKAA